MIQSATGLDGGGSVAADHSGNVYVAWHAGDEHQGEAGRQVWVAHSADDGRTFSREAAAFPKATGACGCCAMRAFADAQDNVYLLYRTATIGELGHGPGVPVWGLPSALVGPGEGFVIFY